MQRRTIEILEHTRDAIGHVEWNLQTVADGKRSLTSYQMLLLVRTLSQARTELSEMIPPFEVEDDIAL